MGIRIHIAVQAYLFGRDLAVHSLLVYFLKDFNRLSQFSLRGQIYSLLCKQLSPSVTTHSPGTASTAFKWVLDTR